MPVTVDEVRKWPFRMAMHMRLQKSSLYIQTSENGRLSLSDSYNRRTRETVRRYAVGDDTFDTLEEAVAALNAREAQEDAACR